MSKIEFNCLPTMIGSVPYTDSGVACKEVMRYLKDVPAWPQLPRRSFFENMYVQYSQGFPGIVVKDEKIFVDREQNLDIGLEKLYGSYLENKYDDFKITPEYAAGLYQFLTYNNLPVRAVKGQLTGPISWGMTVADSNGRAVAYDETLADAAARMLRLKAIWMENELRAISKNTVIFLDEPYLNSVGSAFFAINKEKVVKLLEEVFSGIKGLKGVHCCGNTDWAMLLGTSLDILNFDAYEYAATLALYPAEVKRFIGRGGTIAWGIVPNREEKLDKESVNSLQDRLEDAIAPFTRKGIDIPFRQLISQSLLTPCCGIAGLSPDAASGALGLLSDLSTRVRSKYGS
jgi:methionine synthase II (cobalamin-independent)